jgi:hypothetical protein
MYISIIVIPPFPFEGTIGLVPIPGDGKPQKIRLIGSGTSKFVFCPLAILFRRTVKTRGLQFFTTLHDPSVNRVIVRAPIEPAKTG